MKSITIDGTEYVPAAASEVQIATLDRSWNIVGHCSIAGDWLTITRAQAIRYWGTTRGLGEIASGGPTSKTKLDPMGVVRVPLGSLVHMLDCDPAKWEGVL